MVNKMTKLPDDYIVSCNTSEESAEVWHYYYDTSFTPYHWDYIVCTMELKANPVDKRGPSIMSGLRGEHRGIPIFTYNEWKALVKKRGNLPQYWAVECPHDYKTNKGWRLVVDYLRNMGSQWNGDSVGSYYGYDGNTQFNSGIDFRLDVSHFKNPVTVLTIEEFLELTKQDVSPEFVLPEKWLVRYSNKAEFNAIKDHFKKNWGYVESPNNGYYTPSSRNNWMTDANPLTNYDYLIFQGYTEITFEEFKQHVSKQQIMDKEIIGYKAPFKLFGEVPAGTLYKPLASTRNNTTYAAVYKDGTVMSSAYNMPKEIVETWTPVYNDTKKELYFGDVKFTITPGADYAETSYGKVTKKEIGDMLEYIKNPPRLLSYKLSKNQEACTLFGESDKVYIGCKSGTVYELQQIYKALC